MKIVRNGLEKERLLICCFSTGWTYCDTAKERHGDYVRVAYQSYETLGLEVYEPRSPLLPEIEAEAARMQAKRGEDYPYSVAGQTIRLGGRECAKGTEVEAALRQRRNDLRMNALGDNCSGPPHFEENEEPYA